MKIYAIIPARIGSKSIPKKNIKLLGGFPMVAYSIAAAKLAKNIDRVIVSTDAQEIADIAKKYGAEVPFLRPAEFSRDESGDWDVLHHAKEWLKKNEGSYPDMFVYLRPTTPLRDPEVVDRGIEHFKKNPQATSMRSAHEFGVPPQKMYQINSEGYFEGFFPNDPRPEYYVLPRQNFPKAYCPNGFVDIARCEFINKDGRVYGPRILSFTTGATPDIDLPEDFDYLEYQLIKNGSPLYDYLKKNFKK